jgi:hypothetical protein
VGGGDISNCQNEGGHIPNQASCKCGDTTTCTTSTGLFCKKGSGTVASTCSATAVCKLGESCRLTTGAVGMCTDFGTCMPAPPKVSDAASCSNDDFCIRHCSEDSTVKDKQICSAMKCINRICSDGKQVDGDGHGDGDSGSISKITCSPGQAYIVTANMCIDCPYGKFNDKNAHQEMCMACATGKFNDLLKAKACKDCEPNKYNDQIGATSCKLCESGKSSLSGKSECVTAAPAPLSCTKGQYASSTGCKTCPANQYNDMTTGTNCKACPSGTVIADNGIDKNLHDDITDCAASSNNDSESSKVTCSLGQAYIATVKTCNDCHAGKFNDKKSHHEMCMACTKGRFKYRRIL